MTPHGPAAESLDQALEAAETEIRRLREQGIEDIGRTAREWLDAAQARSDAATDGPWAVYQTMHADPRVVRAGRGVMGTVAVPAHSPDDYGKADAEFIAAARTDAPAMVAALRAVLERHHGLHLCDGTWYAGDDESYKGTIARRQPCPTVRDIDAALGTVTS